MALSRLKTWIAGEVLTASDLNSEFNNVLNNALTLISPLTADLAAGGFKLTGLGAGAALTDSATLQQVQYNFGAFLTSVAGTNTITATATPTPAYTIGQVFTFTPAVTNTGAVTLNISSVGAGAVQLLGAALTGGELQASLPVTVIVTAATPVFEIVQPTQFTDARALIVGATDATKKIRFEADGITTGTTRVITMPDSDVTLVSIPSTTAMVFYQASPPTGWTAVAVNEHALRVVTSGGTGGTAGGTVDFTTAFASQAVSGTTDGTSLSIAQLAAHTHTAVNTTSAALFASGGAVANGGQNTSSTGSGSTHTHTFTGTAIDLAVKYADIIIATKD